MHLAAACGRLLESASRKQGGKGITPLLLGLLPPRCRPAHPVPRSLLFQQSTLYHGDGQRSHPDQAIQHMQAGGGTLASAGPQQCMAVAEALASAGQPAHWSAAALPPSNPAGAAMLPRPLGMAPTACAAVRRGAWSARECRDGSKGGEAAAAGTVGATNRQACTAPCSLLPLRRSVSRCRGDPPTAGLATPLPVAGARSSAPRATAPGAALPLPPPVLLSCRCCAFGAAFACTGPPRAPCPATPAPSTSIPHAARNARPTTRAPAAPA